MLAAFFWRWRKQGPPKYLYQFTKLHGVFPAKTLNFKSHNNHNTTRSIRIWNDAKHKNRAVNIAALPPHIFAYFYLLHSQILFAI